MTDLTLNKSLHPIHSKLKNPHEIDFWLKSMNISSFIIQEDLTVDIMGDLNLYGKQIKEIPVQFGTVEGDFLCGSNELKTLKGSPYKIGGNFSCAFNNLVSLELGPQIVLGDYYCMGNSLVSLKGAPLAVGSFNCAQNQLTSLKDGPQEVNSDYVCSNNLLTSIAYSPKIIPNKFYCNLNQLTSLLDGPEVVSGRYQCSNNKLTNLIGVAQQLGEMDCSANPLTSLKGLPHSITHDLDISSTLITEIDVDVKFENLEHLIQEGFSMLKGFESLYQDSSSDAKTLSINYDVFNSIQTILNEKKWLEEGIKNNKISPKKLKV
jgi:hypothetical protein